MVNAAFVAALAAVALAASAVDYSNDAPDRDRDRDLDHDHDRDHDRGRVLDNLYVDDYVLDVHHSGRRRLTAVRNRTFLF